MCKPLLSTGIYLGTSKNLTTLLTGLKTRRNLTIWTATIKGNFAYLVPTAITHWNNYYEFCFYLHTNIWGFQNWRFSVRLLFSMCGGRAYRYLSQSLPTLPLSTIAQGYLSWDLTKCLKWTLDWDLRLSWTIAWLFIQVRKLSVNMR